MPLHMSRTRRSDRLVAVMIAQDELAANHVATYSGIRRYAMEKPNWRLVVDAFADFDFGKGDRRYSGVIGRATRRLIEQTRRLGVPVVNVWFNSTVAKDLPTVVPNAASAGRMAMEHLIGRGLRHFGTLQYRGDKLRHVMFKEFRERVKAEGMDYSERLLPVGFFDKHQKWEAGQEIIKKWVESWELPIGVLAQYDDFAQALLDVAMSRHGISIPHDLALIGCGNELPLCVRPDIKLTSIDMNYRLVGYTAAKLLDSLMDGAEPPSEPILIEPVGLIARQSTDVLAVEDPVVARALRFIAENCHRRIQVGHVAKAASASLRSLQRSFQEAIGRSIFDQIEYLRVERAKRLLAESRKSAKELARECGFGGYDHFYAVFKRREGLAPAQYRKQRRAEMA